MGSQFLATEHVQTYKDTRDQRSCWPSYPKYNGSTRRWLSFGSGHDRLQHITFSIRCKMLVCHPLHMQTTGRGWHLLRSSYLFALHSLTASCKMGLDISKSWVWSTDKSWRKRLSDDVNLIPYPKINSVQKSHAKYLGEIVQYSKSPFALPMIDLLDQACKRLENNQWLPFPLGKKCLRIQASVMSLALYRSDLH